MTAKPTNKAKFTASCPICRHPMSASSEAGMADALRDHQSWHQAPELFKNVVRAGGQ